MAGSTIAVALTGSDQIASAAHCTYSGFTIRETAGSTAVVKIYNHASAASGTLLETIALAANESAGDWYECGIVADKGVYVKITSGAVEGSVRLS